MYSYAERMRAVLLYIKLDRRMNATICQLGYPTKNSLKDWYREFECRGDLSGTRVAGSLAVIFVCGVDTETF